MSKKLPDTTTRISRNAATRIPRDSTTRIPRDATTRIPRALLDTVASGAAAAPMQFVWPAPPYYEFIADEVQQAAEECLLSFRDGAKATGALLDFLPDDALLKIRQTNTTAGISIGFPGLLGLHLLRPVTVRRQAIRLGKIGACLERLSPKARQVLRLRFHAELTLERSSYPENAQEFLRENLRSIHGRSAGGCGEPSVNCIDKSLREEDDEESDGGGEDGASRCRQRFLRLGNHETETGNDDDDCGESSDKPACLCNSCKEETGKFTCPNSCSRSPSGALISRPSQATSAPRRWTLTPRPCPGTGTSTR